MKNVNRKGHFIDRIKEHCEIQDECWEWRGRVSKGSPFITLSWEGKREHLTVRKFLFLADNPEVAVSRRDTFYATCGNPHCVNPKHLAVGNGAGTITGQRIAKLLKAYKALIADGGRWNVNRASKALGVSHNTLSTYLALYNANPQYWEKLWTSL